MTAPSPLGDRSIAWIQTSFSPFEMPYLWSIDNRSGRASLLKEITPLYDPLYVPQPLLRLGEKIYFTAYGAQGYYSPGPVVVYLWSTDGTPGGTLPVSSPEGDGFEYPAPPTLLGGSLYFFASAGTSEYKLWKTDGTTKGTVAMQGVRGIPPSFVGFEGFTAVGLFQPPLKVIGGKPLFFALSDRDPYRPYALYRLNEASSNATFLQDFTQIPGPMVEMGGIGYFSGVDSNGVASGAHGQELWRTDGTPEGTRIVRDINPGGRDSYPQSLTVVGPTLFFSANDGVHGPELWKTDGTEAGTILVKDIGSGAIGQPPGSFVAASGQLFFLANDGVHGNELWRTDGTPDGTRLVKDVRPGSDSSNPAGLLPFGPWLLFSADDGSHGQELWRTDGTESGTAMVADIAPGSAASTPQAMTVYGNAVYFSADDSVHGRELWQTDGTPAGTRLVADLLPGGEGSDPFVVADPASSLFVLAVDPSGLSLWALAGSTPVIEHVVSLESGTRAVSSNPYLLTDVAGKLCFFTNLYPRISDLWTSDGTEDGTQLLATVQPDAPAPVSAGTSLYFNGFTEGGSVKSKFFRLDSVTNILQPVFDTWLSGPLKAVGQTLYFTLNYSELWRTDAASGDVVLVKKFNGSPVALVASGSVLYVSVAGPSAGLWKTDGSESGTIPVWSGFADQLADAAGSLYFTSYDYPSRLASLWVIAPGAPSAVLVRTFPLDQSGDPASDLTGAGSSIYFLVRDSTRNFQPRLWKSDGTGGGTLPLSGVTVKPGSVRSDGSRVYFVASDEERGSELWTSDGTPQGTSLVKDINPGFFDSTPLSLTVIDGVLLFSADDGLHGRELWRSDGTADGTYLLDDICPNACSSSPTGFTKSGPRIFFAANDHEAGNELWAMPASAIQSPPDRKPRAPVVPRR